MAATLNFAAPAQLIGKHALADLSLNDTPASKRQRCDPSELEFTGTDTPDDVRCGERRLMDPSTDVHPASPISTSSSSQKTKRPKIYICNFENCTKAFSRPCLLEDHKRSHTGERPFKCLEPGCNKDFLRDSHLKAHIAGVHSDERKCVCEHKDCGRAFTNNSHLKEHYKTHDRHNKHRCSGYPPCGEHFRKASTLEKHIETVHLLMKAHRCAHIDAETGQKCTANFDKISQLRSHEAEEHGEARYWCSICPSESAIERVGFGTYHALQNHIKEAHPPYCTVCGLVCSSNAEVKHHMEIQHSGTTLDERKKFTCTHPGCNKSFTKQGNLTIHVNSVHAVVKPYRCGVTDLTGTPGIETWDPAVHCDAAYTAKQTLVKHIMNHHLPESVPKKQRKAMKLKQPRKPNISSLLTGVELPQGAPGGTESYQNCIVPLCDFHFKGRKGIEKHARIAHGMDEAEISEAILEREAKMGGKFWVGGDDDEDEMVDFAGEWTSAGWGPGEEDDFTGLDRVAFEVGGSYGANFVDM